MLLQAQDDQLRAVRAVLSSAVDRMASLVGRSSDTQLLVTTTDMIGSLTALENQLPHLEPQADSELEFTIDLKYAVSWLSELGEVSDKSTFAGKTTAQGPGLEKGPGGLVNQLPSPSRPTTAPVHFEAREETALSSTTMPRSMIKATGLTP